MRGNGDSGTRGREEAGRHGTVDKKLAYMHGQRPCKQGNLALVPLTCLSHTSILIRCYTGIT